MIEFSLGLIIGAIATAVIATRFRRSKLHTGADAQEDANDPGGALVDDLCDALEDPNHAWEQDEFYLSLHVDRKYIQLWTSSGIDSVRLTSLGGHRFSILQRHRVWRSVQVARRNILRRQLGIHELPPIRAVVVESTTEEKSAPGDEEIPHKLRRLIN